MGGGSGSSPEVSDSASVAVTFDYHHRGSRRSSDGGPESEVLMKGRHDVRKFDLLVEFAARIAHRICLVTAAFLILGYGNGSSPSASFGDHLMTSHCSAPRSGGGVLFG
jgi:hypothetical protein